MVNMKRLLAAAGIFAVLAAPASVMADNGEGPSISKAIDWAVEIAHDPFYGYTQEGRWGSEGYDCSSFVITAFWKGGFNLGYDSKYDGCTGDIRDAFTEAGFEWIPAEDLQLETGSIDLLKPGDILLIEGYHAEMYIGDGLTVAAHEDIPSNDHPNRSKAAGDQGDEISVYNYVLHPWTGVLRYKGRLAEEEINYAKASPREETDEDFEEENGAAEKSEEETVSETASDSEDKANVYEVLVDSLLVRAEPDSDSRVIELLEENEQIKVTDIQGEWGLARVRGKEGYVNLSYARRLNAPADESDPVEEEPTEEEKVKSEDNEENLILTVNIDTLFMRQEPDKEAPVVCVLDEYDKIKLLSHTGDWGYVSFGEFEGWVNLDYCI